MKIYKNKNFKSKLQKKMVNLKLIKLLFMTPEVALKKTVL